MVLCLASEHSEIFLIWCAFPCFEIDGTLFTLGNMSLVSLVAVFVAGFLLLAGKLRKYYIKSMSILVVKDKVVDVVLQ